MGRLGDALSWAATAMAVAAAALLSSAVVLVVSGLACLAFHVGWAPTAIALGVAAAFGCLALLVAARASFALSDMALTSYWDRRAESDRT